jgi:AcrR family transcriptional regulator
MGRRTGRRPGKQDTQQAILDAARRAFAERGYDGASIRQIAGSAGVDPGLVHHYFGSKQELFLAVLRPPVEPDTVIAKAFDGGVDSLGERLADTFLSVWEDPSNGPAFEALLRSALANEMSASLLREFFATQIVRRVLSRLATHVDPAEIPLRASLAASQLFGLAVIRYVLKFEPLASTPRAAVVAAAGPNLQRYLTGDLGGRS